MSDNIDPAAANDVPEDDVACPFSAVSTYI